jgi:hypothetical protein
MRSTTSASDVRVALLANGATDHRMAAKSAVVRIAGCASPRSQRSNFRSVFATGRCRRRVHHDGLQEEPVRHGRALEESDDVRPLLRVLDHAWTRHRPHWPRKGTRP